MKPTTKLQRTGGQRAERGAVRRRHAAKPIRGRRGANLSRRSFAAILKLLGQFKAVRESRGLSLADVAERMGTDAPALSRLETGKLWNPTLATVHRWAAALGLRLEVDLSRA